MPYRTLRRRYSRRHALGVVALGLGGFVAACGGGDDTPSAGNAAPEAAAGRAPATSGGTKPGTPPATTAAGVPAVCLVTKQQGLNRAYVPPDLVVLPEGITIGEPVRLREEAADAVVRLVDTAKGEGQVLEALSGFRTYDEQDAVLKQVTTLVGRDNAAKQVAPPGHSEHQLGLAVDLNSMKTPYELRWQLGEEPEGRWLAKHAHRFGFVLSYPDGKEGITGYEYEPWHIRFVGAPLAEQVVASGLTLTEYLPKHNLAGQCPS